YTVGTNYTIGFEVKSEGIHQITNDKNIGVTWGLKASSLEKGKQQELYWAQTYYRFKGTNDVEYELLGSDEWTEKESIDWVAFKQQFFSSVPSFPEGFQNPTGGSTPIDQEVDPLHSKDYHFAASMPVSGSELNYKMQWTSFRWIINYCPKTNMKEPISMK